MTERVAIILAAGDSSRMKTKWPKVLHEICGQPLVSYIFDVCRQVGVEKIFAVVGYGKEHVIERYKDCDDIVFVEQNEQRGTGHAVLCCKEHLADFNGGALILHGDVPLILPETLKTIINKHQQESAAATLGTAVLEDPSGYGRVIRDSQGNIQAIIEEVDCTEEQLKIKEMNPAFYYFNTQLLLEMLEKITPDNAKNEYYLPDALRLAIATGHKVAAVTAVTEEEALGVNDRQQFSVVGKLMQRRIQQKLMDSGVTIVDPDNTWIDARAKVGQDTVIEPFTYVHGQVRIGKGCRVGPFAYLSDGMVIKDGSDAGPGTGVSRENVD